MRPLILAALVLIGLTTAAAAQECEEMVIRNAEGVVVSQSIMCVGLDGTWEQQNAPLPPVSKATGTTAPKVIGAPAPVGVKRIEGPKPVYTTPLAASTPIAAERRALRAPAEAPAPNTRAFQPVPEPIDVTPAPPVIVEVEPAPVYQVQEPAVLVPAPAPTRVVPTEIPAPVGTATDRHATYAKLGLVCVAEQARDCSLGGCGGLCAGQTGWCDGLTGEAYTSLAAIERVYCRKK